jgi:hypothetical protein
MGSLVFVHGIGVRALADGGEHPLDATSRAIGWELFFRTVDWKIVKCNWGDRFGARLLADGRSFPPLRGKLGVPIRPDDPADLWEILFRDPTSELRIVVEMTTTASSASRGPPGTRPPWLDLGDRLTAGLAPRDAGEDRLRRALDERLETFQLTAFFAQALTQIKADPATQAAIKHPEASQAIARAIVARSVRTALEAGVPPPGLTELEFIASQVQQLLFVGHLGGSKNWARSVLLGWGTSLAERRRMALLEAATPLAGDVILYQAHGEVIRDEIHKVISNEADTVAILAHSLGGVAAMEALCENGATRNRVKKLITVGSQAGFFYEINGLRTLPFGQPLPEGFPDWLNFWDSRDFLSFAVNNVFSGGRSRRDVEIESGLPFPASHSGYWRQSLTWEEITTFLRRTP